MEGLWRHVRLALRHHWARRGAALFSVAVLALGIGGTIATVALVRGVLLRPLPFLDADQLVSVGRSPFDGRGAPILTGPELQRLREAARTLEDVGAWVPRGVVLRDAQGADAVAGGEATTSLFALLRVSPHLGRLFEEADAGEGAQRVAMVSYRTWTRRFGSDSELIGSAVELDGEPHVVVGVLPQGFALAEPSAEVWTPLMVRSDEGDADGEWSFSRLSPGSVVFADGPRHRRGQWRLRGSCAGRAMRIARLGYAMIGRCEWLGSGTNGTGHIDQRC